MVRRTTANGVFRRRNGCLSFLIYADVLGFGSGFEVNGFPNAGLPFSARCAADRRRARSWKYRDQYYRRPAAPPVRVLRQSEGLENVLLKSEESSRFSP
jgi:hypothetical protein